MVMSTQQISYLLAVVLKMIIFQVADDEMAINANSYKFIDAALFQIVKANAADLILEKFI